VPKARRAGTLHQSTPTMTCGAIRWKVRKATLEMVLAKAD